MEQEMDEKKTHTGIVNFEKRRYPRFKVDLPIQYSVADSPVVHTGRTLDASQGGLLLYISEEVEIGQRLKLNLSFYIDSDWTTIKAIAEVAWMDIHLGRDWGDYRAGVRFVDISPEDMANLNRFLETRSI
jgi:c-di-GMP-binding flagellar brake protein YcgR